MPRSAQQWFDEYGSSHQNPTNKLIHWLMVPTIFFTIVGLLWNLPLPTPLTNIQGVNWASIILIPVLIFYASLSWTLMLGMLAFSLVCFMLAWQIDISANWPLWQISLTLFVIAWIFQFIGHKIEGKKPSFFKDVQFLLIGPAWLLGFIYRKLGIHY